MQVLVVAMVAAELAAAAGRFAGRDVAVDARLVVPECAAPAFAVVGERVEVRCVAPAWRVFLPFVAVPVVEQPVLRRGERVEVLVLGAGFEVSMAAVVEGAGGAGRVWVKRADGEGRRLLARVREDGRVVIGG